MDGGANSIRVHSRVGDCTRAPAVWGRPEQAAGLSHPKSWVPVLPDPWVYAWGPRFVPHPDPTGSGHLFQLSTRHSLGTMPTQALHRDWFQALGGLDFKGNSQGSYQWPEQGSDTAPRSLARSLPYKEGEKQGALDGVPGPRQGLGV